MRCRAPYLLIAVLVLGSGFGIVLGLAESPRVEAQPPLPGNPLAVPTVVGDTAAAAESAIENAGLIPKVVPMPSSAVPLGRIVQEEPTPGTTVAHGSAITLYQSSGFPLPNDEPAFNAPQPTTRAATPLCQLAELNAAAVSYDVGGTVLSPVFFIDNTGTTPCAIPAEVDVTFLTANGSPFGSSEPPGEGLQPGFFVLQSSAGVSPDRWWSPDGGHATVISSIGNWCGRPYPPTSAELELSGIGTVAVPVSVIDEGIECYNAALPPDVVSPDEVAIP